MLDDIDTERFFFAVSSCGKKREASSLRKVTKSGKPRERQHQPTTMTGKMRIARIRGTACSSTRWENSSVAPSLMITTTSRREKNRRSRKKASVARWSVRIALTWAPRGGLRERFGWWRKELTYAEGEFRYCPYAYVCVCSYRETQNLRSIRSLG